MQIHSTAMSVADFLDSLADQASADGLDNNADVYRQRALQAKQQEIDLHKLRAANQDMQDRLNDIARTARPAAA